MIDPFEKANIPTDAGSKRERREEAEELLEENGVFMLSLKSLSRKWYAEMITSLEPARREAASVKLQALEAIVPEMRRFITDHKMALDKQRKHAS
jgi:hypothetical protein